METNWFKEAEISLTVADKDGKIIYMNDLANLTFAKYGDLIGRSLYECHSENSNSKIKRMLKEGSSNIYTIEKLGKKKIIIQLPWKINGITEGIMELSVVLPDPLPHFIRE
ncbi:MAG: hypothetical protein PWR20_285 [Bacteroidales bacterium]|jgi:DUF438 domain-containing protein|nr:hypothetical protein [Bacteroidales bacterium]MDN5328353.1 hypothetical protein [Bacteroidales bacterium]